jgi:Skp family chaperone for outer membrane proteins
MKATSSFVFVMVALLCSFSLSGSAHGQGTNVAVIDISQIFQQHQRFRGELETIKGAIKQFESSLNGDRDALRQKSEQLKLLTPGSPEYRQMEGEFARMTSDVQVKMGLKKKDFLQQEAKVYYQAYLEIQTVIREFSERNRIGLVLRFNGQAIDPQKRDSVLGGINRAVVYQDRLNITGEILAMLNRGVQPVPTPGPTGPVGPAASRSQVPRRR